jgi:hypothetical protein
MSYAPHTSKALLENARELRVAVRDARTFLLVKSSGRQYMHAKTKIKIKVLIEYCEEERVSDTQVASWRIATITYFCHGIFIQAYTQFYASLAHPPTHSPTRSSTNLSHTNTY